YAERAGLSFAEIIGKPYWECFPRRDGPLPGCLDAACTASAGPREEFCLPDGGVYTSRAFPLGRVQASEPQALHLFEDITQERRLEEAGQARTRRILAQSAALSAISSLSALYAGDVQQLAREITERVSWACSVERVNAWLFNAQETELNCIDHFDAAAKNHSSGMVLRQVQFENEFRALKSGSHVAADDALTDPRTSGYVEGYLKPNRIVSMLDTVIEISGKHLGLLCLEHVDLPHHWEEDEIAFAGQIAEKIAIAISNRAARIAEQATRASELRLRTIFEQSPVGISESSLTGQYQHVNRRLCEITGYSEEELRTRTFRDITHPDDIGQDERKLAELLSGQASYYSTEKRYVHKSGRIVWVSLLVTPVCDENGVIQFLLTIAEEITARKEAEAEVRRSSEALLQSEQRLAGILNSQDTLIARADADNRLTYMNAAYERAFGLKLGDRFTVKIHPDDVASTAAAVAKLRDPPYVCSFEERCEIRGEWRWVRWNDSTVRDAGGQIVEIQAVGLDITERKQAQAALEGRERYYRKLIEGSSDAFFVIDKTGRLAFRSESAARLTDSGTAIPPGKELAAFFKSESLPGIRRVIAEVIEQPGKQSRAELRIARKDGSVTEVEAFGKNLLGDADVNGIVVTTHDITERNAAERSLRESEQRFRATFDHTPDGIIVMDIEARTARFVNASMQNLLGYDPGEMAGLSLSRMIPPDALAQVTAQFDRGAQADSS
ncbi:MAG TPA: PAS domain S-box protein, partial [Steroidobacteraceae bacterium]|nr:PAS domain S-box protein [Steroidobacteraceae bacterium]